MLRDVKLGTKIMGGFALVLLLLAGVLGIYQYALSRATGGYEHVLKGEVLIADHAGEIETRMLKCRQVEKDFLLRPDKESLGHFDKAINALRDEAKALGDLGSRLGKQEVISKASAIMGCAKEYQKAFKDLVASWERRGLNHESGLQGDLKKLVNSVEESLAKFNIFFAKTLFFQIRGEEKDYLLYRDEKYLKKTHEGIQKLLSALKNSGISQSDMEDPERAMAAYWAGLEALVTEDRKLSGLAETMSAAITKIEPLAEGLRKIAEEAAALKQETTKTQSHTLSLWAMGMGIGAIVLGMILSCFIVRSLTGPVNRLIEGMSEGAAQVASASAQVSTASQSLAEGASEQAASLEETSSSLEEMSSMTKQNADNALQADSLMKEANRVVGEANKSMVELTKSMEEISKASEETSRIIKSIDEIAFQTNLLALNAAVEAARAGEAGAGFAVVADEVRNLAMRAADAAKNTSNLIDGTAKKIKEGSDLVKKTNENFAEVAKSSVKVAQLITEIAAASNEQAQGIEQVNKTVAEMDKVVQQNAGNAEENASASGEMNAQAAQMKGYVQDLVALVGGKRKTEKRKSHSGEGPMEVIVKRAALVPEERDGKSSGVRTKEVRPEQIIPMEDNDFKEF